MFRRIFAILVILSISACATTAFAAEFLPFKGRISNDAVNVRSDSTISSRMLCQLPKNEPVDVVAESYDWYRIRLPSQVPAYIRKDMLSCIDKPEPGTVTPRLEPAMPAADSAGVIPCRSAKVIKSDVNVRLGPDESSWVVGRVGENQVVSVTGESGNWYQVVPPDGCFGWVHKKFVRKHESPAVETAAAKSESAVLPPLTADTELVLTGEVQPYGRVFRRQAAFKLLSSDNKVYLLQGNKQDLNVLIGRRVKITGTPNLKANSKLPVIIVRAVETLK